MDIYSLLPLSNYFLIVLVCITIGLAAIFFYRVFKKEEAFEKKQEDVFENYKKILQRARIEARRILNKATEESVQVYQEAHITNEKIIEELDTILQRSLKNNIKKFDTFSDLFLSEYKQALDTLQKEFIVKSQEKITTLQLESDSALSQYTSSMKDTFGSMNKTVENKMREAFAAVDAQTETYKQEQYKKMDVAMRSVVLQTYKEILGQNITLSIHTELIKNALEQAKKEGIFSQWETKE